MAEGEGSYELKFANAWSGLKWNRVAAKKDKWSFAEGKLRNARRPGLMNDG